MAALSLISPPLTTRQAPAPPLQVVDVRQFGARADGSSDDAAAINAAVQYIRSHQHKVDASDVCFKLLFSCGVYRVDASINMTGLHGVNIVVDGDASVILARCADRPVIDALGSRWLTIRDLTIVGDTAATPRVGIQIGRSRNGIVADDHRMENIKLIGHYTLACLMNLAAETSGFDHLLLWNARSDPKSYCLIQDGLNHFGTKSEFLPDAMKTEQDDSFNENDFVNCDFRHAGGGVPVWLGNTARHKFFRCYAAGDGLAAFVIYCGNNPHLMLDIDCHCETGRLQSVFLFTGPRSHTRLQGFSYVEHHNWAARAVLSCASHMELIDLRDARIEIGGFANPACALFDDPSKWLFTGLYSAPDGTGWNGAGRFKGILMRGNELDLTGQVGLTVQSGPSRNRPSDLDRTEAGRLFMDLSLNKLIVWSGNAWVDAMGARV